MASPLSLPLFIWDAPPERDAFIWLPLWDEEMVFDGAFLMRPLDSPKLVHLMNVFWTQPFGRTQHAT